MALEVAAERNFVVVDPLDDHERIRGQLSLAQRVVLELQLGRELHQLRPVGARTGAHRRTIGSEEGISSIDQRPVRSTEPVSPPAGKTKKLAASSSVCKRRPPSASTSAPGR